MSNYKKLGKNVVLLTIGNFSSKILTFLLVPFYTAVLTKEEYGTADLVTTTINLVLPIFTMLIYEAVLRYALEKREQEQIFSWGFYITLVGTIVAVLCSPILYFFDNLNNFILLFVLYFASLAFYNLILQFAKGIDKVLIFSIAGILNTLIYILCNLLFLLVFSMGVNGYLLASIVSHTLVAIITFFWAKEYKYIVSIKSLSKPILKNLLAYSVPMVPNSISWWMNNSLNKYILVFFCGAAANGLYSVSNKIPTILTIFVTIFIGAWQISSVEDFGSDESKKFYTNVYDKYESFLYVVGSALIVGVKILANILFSNDFYEAWIYTPFLVYAFVLSSQASFFGSIYTASRKTKMILVSTLIGAVVNVLINLILIKPLGVLGVTIATSVGYIVIVIIRLIDTRKILAINISVVRDVFANLLLILQAILVCFSKSLISVPVLLCFVIICILCKKTIFEVVKGVWQKLKKAKSN